MKYKILLMTYLVITSFVTINAMVTNPLKKKMYDQIFAMDPKDPSKPDVKTRMASLGRNFYDLYKASFFPEIVDGKKGRIRNAKAYLNYIILLLDLPGNQGATIKDLPTTPTGEDLAKQTQQVLDRWNLDLINIAAGKFKSDGKTPADANWIILPKGATLGGGGAGPEAVGKTLAEAITLATDAAKAVSDAIAAASEPDKTTAATGAKNIAKALVDKIAIVS